MKQILLLAAAFLMGCSNNHQDGDYEYIKPGTYVLCYYPILSFEVYTDENKLLWLYENPAPTTSSIWHTTQSEEFKALSAKHGDHDFPYEFLIGAGGAQNEFFAQDFTSVEITSDRDFDERHPAGSSLKDIVRIYSVSPYKYVKSGYTETYGDWQTDSQNALIKRIWSPELHGGGDLDHVTYGYNKLFPIDYLLSELPEDALVLLGRGEITDKYRRELGANSPFAVLKFEKQPTQQKDHLLSITFTGDDGNKITTQPFHLTW